MGCLSSGLDQAGQCNLTSLLPSAMLRAIHRAAAEQDAALHNTNPSEQTERGGGSKGIQQLNKVYPELLLFFFFFKSQIKSLTAAQHTADRSFIYLSRKRGSAYTRLRNCLVKPLPHYLTFSEKMIVNYFITGKEAFRLVYQNRSHIYPGQGTACKPKQ